MVSALILSIGQSYDNQYMLNLLLTPDFLLYDNLGEYTLSNHPRAMKDLITHDRDTHLLHEAISGEY